MSSLSNKTSKSKQLMTIIHAITLICLTNNIRFTISHIPGWANVHADHLSQLELHRFLNCVEDIESLQLWKPWAWVWPLSTSMLLNLFRQLTNPILTVYDQAWDIFQQFLGVYNKSLDDLSKHLLVEFTSCFSLIPLAPGSIHVRSKAPPQNQTLTWL